MKDLSCFVFRTGLISFVAAVLMTGCEVTSDKKQVEINPGSAALRKGEAVTLLASGGADYSWKLETESMGFLSSRSGAAVQYTSRFTPASGEKHLQKVTVQADISSVNTSNTAILTQTATAYITHLR